MRKKLTTYSIIILLMAVAGSFTVYKNLSSIVENQKILLEETKIHEGYDHLTLELQIVQSELYRNSPDLERLAGAMKRAESYLETPASGMVEESLKRMREGFGNYKDKIGLVISATNLTEKWDSAGEAHQIGKVIFQEAEVARKISTDMIEETYERILDTTNSSKWMVIVTVVIVVFVAIIGLVHITSTVAYPLSSFIRSVENIGKSGDLSVRAGVPRDRDLAILTETFNNMMENLETWDKELKGNYEELQVNSQVIKSSYANLEELTTELEEKSQELSESNEEMQSFDRMKIEFMQNISHELRTPLTPIIGYLELFLNKDLGEISPEHQEIMDDMYHCTKRLSFVIDSLLEMVSLQEEEATEKYEPVDTVSMVNEVESPISEEAMEGGLSFKFETDDNIPHVQGARNKLILMLRHVLKNAIKFNAEGGKVFFSVRRGEGNLVDFVVEDNGIGISEERLENIFEPFFQVDGSTTRGYEGAGLGLALTKRVVELHRGKINIESKEGEGTSVKISIPSA